MNIGNAIVQKLRPLTMKLNSFGNKKNTFIEVKNN